MTPKTMFPGVRHANTNTKHDRHRQTQIQRQIQKNKKKGAEILSQTGKHLHCVQKQMNFSHGMRR